MPDQWHTLHMPVLSQEVIPSEIPLHRFADDHSVKKVFRGGSQNNSEERKTIEYQENGAKTSRPGWTSTD